MLLRIFIYIHVYSIYIYIPVNNSKTGIYKYIKFSIYKFIFINYSINTVFGLYLYPLFHLRLKVSHALFKVLSLRALWAPRFFKK
jgi:hypothetical protein